MKRLLAIALGLVLLIGTMAGCQSSGQQSSSTASSSESSKASDSGSSESSSSGTSASEASSQPAGNGLEYVQLKAISVGDPTEPFATNFKEKLNEMLLEDLNCELDIEYLSWSGWRDQYPLVLASGEDFDFIYTSSWCFYGDQAQKGAFLELKEEDLKKYMPLTYEAVGDAWKQTYINGKIYMIPMTKKEFGDHSLIGVRGDLMEEAGLEEITSPEDIETYVESVQKNHPGMNILNVSGGFDMGSWATEFVKIMLDKELPYTFIDETHKFGITGLSCPVIFDYTDPSNLKMVDEEEADQYYLTLYNKSKEYREKGYWSSDCLSATTAIEEYFISGNGALVLREIENVRGYCSKLYETNPETNPRMFRLVDSPYRTNPGTNNGIAIHATSKNPERTMMVLEKLGYDQVYHDLLCLGFEGVHYTLNEDGTVKTIENPEYPASEPTSMGLQTSINRLTEPKPYQSDQDYMNYYEEALQNGVTPLLDLFTFDTSAVTTELASCTAVNSQYLPILNTGMAEDVEATYNEYKSELKIGGIDAITAEYMRQAQEFLNSMQ